jgi:hypothetical protein
MADSNGPAKRKQAPIHSHRLRLARRRGFR